MSLTHACVVVPPAEAAAARVLLEGLRRHEPDLRITVVALPGARADMREVSNIDLLSPADLALPVHSAAVASSSQVALARAVRPLILDRLLREGAGGVILLPSDAEVRAPLTALRTALQTASMVVLPRLIGRLPDDGERPDASDLDEAGMLDDELVAVRAGSERILTWWVGRTALCAPGTEVAATDTGGASPLAAAAATYEEIVRLDDPAYNISYWNLHERPLSLTPDGTLLCCAEPAIVMRFAGFRPDRPWWLSEHATRFSVIDDPVLQRVCRDRVRKLREAGWDPAEHGDAGTVLFAGRLMRDERVARLQGEAAELGEQFDDLDDPRVAEAFIGWLRGPAPAGILHGITRYAFDVWRSRPDVRAAYPDLDDKEDGPGFVGWLWVHGRPELGLDPQLLPPAPIWLDVDGEIGVPAVQVVGYLRGALGLGGAARGYVAALQAAAVEVSTHSVPLDGPADGRAERRNDELAFDDVLAVTDPGVVLACVNAPQLPGLVDDLGADAFAGRYLIGQWAWETDHVPDYWAQALGMVDEIWTYSTYVADIIAAVAMVPVVAVPLPVQPPEEVAEHLPLDLPDAFTFLFAFDFLSTLQRKNPLGLIEAFCAAFAPGEGPVLVLKTINARLRPEERDRIRFAIGDRPDVLLVDASLTPAELAALFERADCYVSLHRSEGFGLTPAEAMAIGKPVIATRFGGVTDFMTPANSYLVDWERVAVGPDGEHYPAQGTWAEPSVQHAADLMREVWTDRDGAAARGERARADIAAQLSPAAVGAVARQRLRRIGALRSAEATPVEPELPWSLGELDQRLAFDLGGNGASGVRGLARRAALRVTRPYALQERRLDETVAVSLRRMALDLEAMREARERDRDRIARLERRLRG